VRSEGKKQAYFVNRIKDRDRPEKSLHKNWPNLPGLRTKPREKTVLETDATRCEGTNESSRYPFVVARTQQVFSEIWENLSGGLGDAHKRVGEPPVRATPMEPRIRAVGEEG